MEVRRINIVRSRECVYVCGGRPIVSFDRDVVWSWIAIIRTYILSPFVAADRNRSLVCIYVACRSMEMSCGAGSQSFDRHWT